VVTSPDSACGTEATLRNSRQFEPDETLVKPTECHLCPAETPLLGGRSAPSKPKKARIDSYYETIRRHVRYKRRKPRDYRSRVQQALSCSLDDQYVQYSAKRGLQRGLRIPEVFGLGKGV